MELLSRQYNLITEADTTALGAALAARGRPGDVVCLHGDLGAGKSVLARGYIRALCGKDTEVPSPTFTLLQYYEAREFDIIHADLYRLEQAEDIIEIGLEERFGDAVTLIEWPQRLGALRPAIRLDITLNIHKNGRRLAELVPHGKVWESRFESV
ncbi:MAG: tRNA (adenosine(37)-N6)-threonylcarbamoyltransferase complex ATPase subunit type 1 TsaE [Robiginitomaculum sp.]|nr:tRNA (adenosine(37)-N6)-threonylcarbamoyltransferase complex ATPase subunit type 1 TsaE [Robiginitomaculum sp.]MDQ7076716.1 tRNA (adenosine(37)-N6)-threonylcarbamoyltransferase complex ATPase subunit type 1 TsaE [Robiginitomaculum sp.]